MLILRRSREQKRKGALVVKRSEIPSSGELRGSGDMLYFSFGPRSLSWLAIGFLLVLVVIERTYTVLYAIDKGPKELRSK